MEGGLEEESREKEDVMKTEGVKKIGHMQVCMCLQSLSFYHTE